MCFGSYLLKMAVSVDERELNQLLKETTEVAAKSSQGSGAADTVLEQLQEAVREHEKILHQQELLIRQLREQLRGVER